MSSRSSNDDLSQINIGLTERDVFKLILDFLEKRQFYISMLNIERETGIINGQYSEDLLFLRQVILDGQWDDVIEFAQPLETIPEFERGKFQFIIRKHQFLEMLCLKAETQSNSQNVEQQIIKFLNDLQFEAPSEQEFQSLNVLASLKRLQDHADYLDWNPISGRMQCFRDIYPLVNRFLRVDQSVNLISDNDRLMQLIIKGLLYESSMEYCQARASRTKERIDLSNTQNLLNSTKLSPNDVSLLSWLHSLSEEAFEHPFEQKNFSLDIEKHEKPSLDALWSEQILMTPFKAQHIFPFNATRSGKAASTECLVQSIDHRNFPFSSHQFSEQTASNETQLREKPENRQNTKRVTWHDNQVLTEEEYRASQRNILKHFEEEEENEEKPKNNSTGFQYEEDFSDATKTDSWTEDSSNEIASFLKLSIVHDTQVIRAVDVHPTGHYFSVGSNSGTLRICAYPNLNNISNAENPPEAKVLVRKDEHHHGSIYCMSWSPTGQLLATGSNDKLVKVIRLENDHSNPMNFTTETEFKHHRGTIRDLTFLSSHVQDDSMLLSAGTGDNKIHLIDVDKQQLISTYEGHQAQICSIFAWNSQNFVSASQDGTVRLWDIRQMTPVQTIGPRASKVGALAASVESSGHLLTAGYQDSSCLLHDIRSSRTVQVYNPHTNEIRSVRFSVGSYYLLTASYDGRAVITYLTGDLTQPLTTIEVASHSNKIIQARWHPDAISFVTSSADRSCIVWSSPSP